MQREIILVRISLSHHDYIFADLREALATAQLKSRQVLIVPRPQIARGLQNHADYTRVSLVRRHMQRRIQIVIQLLQEHDHLELLQKVLHNVDVAPGAGHMKERLSVAVLGKQELLQTGAILQRLVDECDHFEAGRQVQNRVLVPVS